ncbi:hypothetical protein ILYODFUR_006816 [Ilyodon furcidens]|uniref:Uncharacterized protein n=1 Tax=Ilyodon furcidens TaxID=33524 RepID=A0ABV0TKK5_9TELE
MFNERDLGFFSGNMMNFFCLMEQVVLLLWWDSLDMGSVCPEIVQVATHVASKSLLFSPHRRGWTPKLNALQLKLNAEYYEVISPPINDYQFHSSGPFQCVYQCYGEKAFFSLFFMLAPPVFSLLPL